MYRGPNANDFIYTSDSTSFANSYCFSLQYTNAQAHFSSAEGAADWSEYSWQQVCAWNAKVDSNGPRYTAFRLPRCASQH